MKSAMLTVLLPLMALFYADSGHAQNTLILWPCEGAYVAGDANENMIPLELHDVVTMIAYYRGTDAPVYICECGDNPSYPPCASHDGNCVPFELSDVVAQICAYRGTCTAEGCPNCPPMDQEETK